MNPADFRRLHDVAMDAATAAGRCIAGYAGENVTVMQKDGGDTLTSKVVTDADYASQQCILQKLRPSIERYDLGLLAEESEDDATRFEKAHFWCIDPLDGTRCFAEGRDGYAVSIALVSRTGTSYVGVVHDPVSGTTWSAVRGEGLFRNGEVWNRTQADSGASDFRVYTDRHFQPDGRYAAVIKRLQAAAIEAGYLPPELIPSGGAVLNACMVLENPPAAYFKLPKAAKGGGSLWDYAATAVLFHEAGAIASDIHGHPLNLNQHDSTFMNVEGILYASSAKIAAMVRACAEAEIEGAAF